MGGYMDMNHVWTNQGTPHEPSEEEIRQAAVLANAHDFITALPEGGFARVCPLG